jgi:very-short-patch-repair endonuclease
MKNTIPPNNNYYNKQLQPFASDLRKRMTKAEACLWKYVLRAGMMKGYTFNRQRPVLNFIADFMCKELKLVIEVDGYTHLDEKVQQKDKRKDQALQEAGFTVLRFTDDQVLQQIESVCSTIEAWINEVEHNQQLQ